MLWLCRSSEYKLAENHEKAASTMAQAVAMAKGIKAHSAVTGLYQQDLALLHQLLSTERGLARWAQCDLPVCRSVRGVCQ